MSTRSQEQAELSRWRLLPGKANRSWFSALIASEFAAPGALVAQQDRRLAQILAFASEHVPFYRARFDVLGLHVADIKGQHDLPRLPILSKHEVIEHFDELRAQALPQGTYISGATQSSGTTGRPVVVVATRRSNLMFNILAHRWQRWARVDPMGVLCSIKIASHFPPKNGVLLQNGELWRTERWDYLGNFFETGPAYRFNVWNPMDQQIAWLREIQPKYLSAYPSTFEELAYANDCAKPAESISALFSTASSAAPSTRRQVERIYRAPLHDAYGLNEIGAVAVRCEAGLYHAHAEHCIVEVVDAQGMACPAGQLGRVLVTALQNLAMPLIRYDTGDVARAAILPCPCGRNLPVLAEIAGRFRRFGYLPKGTRERHYALLDAIEAMPVELLKPLRQYQLHQFRDHSFELRVRSAGGMSPEFSARLMRVWAEIAGTEETPLRIVEVDAIKASPSGKQLEFDSDFYPDPEVEIDPRVYLAALERLGQGQ
jgi:phenylacetate-CoA ligase